MVIADGRVIADGSAADVKSGVAGRTISFTAAEVRLDGLPAVSGSPGRAAPSRWPLPTPQSPCAPCSPTAGSRPRVRGASLEDAVLSLISTAGTPRSEPCDDPLLAFQLRRIGRNRQYLVFTVLLPALFTVFFTEIFGGLATARPGISVRRCSTWSR